MDGSVYTAAPCCQYYQHGMLFKSLHLTTTAISARFLPSRIHCSKIVVHGESVHVRIHVRNTGLNAACTRVRQAYEVSFADDVSDAVVNASWKYNLANVEKASGANVSHHNNMWYSNKGLCSKDISAVMKRFPITLFIKTFESICCDVLNCAAFETTCLSISFLGYQRAHTTRIVG